MLIAVFVSLLAVASFGLAVWKCNILPIARKALSTGLSGLSVMTDRDLDDDAKELAVRRAALSLLGAAISIAVRFAAVLAAAFLPILIADLLSVTTIEAVMSLMLRLDYILGVSIVAIACGEMFRRWRKRKPVEADRSQKAASAAGSDYSEVDRFLHDIAFSSPVLQRGVSRLEGGILGAPRVNADPPIFVTSLARGGTTALLNALCRLPGIATHTYRDMPFLTAPVLWDKLAGGRRRSVALKDRAHGDGLKIGLDSPEAFEEVLWKMHWPEKYGDSGIDLWSVADRKPKAERFFSLQMSKIIRARFGQCPQFPVRYCSKNNANIGRIAYLSAAFPDCQIVVPLRQPARHAASLHRQHQNFLELQSRDEFMRRYMRDIGHFEFGQIYRPLRFAGFDPLRYDPSSADHWLDYWIHAFCAVEETMSAGQKIILVTQDSLRERPSETMHKLASDLKISLDHQTFETEFLSTPDVGQNDVFCPDLLKKAQGIYDRLMARAI